MRIPLFSFITAMIMITNTYVSAMELNLPRRDINALTGSAISEKIKNMKSDQKEAFFVDQILSGNVPDYQRTLVEIKTNRIVAGKSVNLSFYTMPDYIAVGSDHDHLRVPLNFDSAKTIAVFTGMVLPTQKMVDSIYKSAAIKLAPAPLKPGSEMHSPEYYEKHNRMIDNKLAGRMGFTAGHKKDVIISKRLLDHRDRIAIYGWHRLNGRRIQPVSLVHGAFYADYSHGIRLVSAAVVLNGKEKTIFDIMKNADLAPLISSEGTLTLYAELNGYGNMTAARNDQNSNSH